MLDLLDQAASRAQSQYSGFLASLRGVYALAQDISPGDVRALTALRNTAWPMVNVFLEAEHEAYRNDLFDVQRTADSAAQTDMTGEASDVPWDTTGEEVADWYVQELAGQAIRDINSLVAARRITALSGQPAQPAFMFKDRAGRQYPADTHVRQTARHGLVLFGVGTYAITAASLGATEMTVTHPDPEHQHNGISAGFPIDPGILTTVFHPNSRAFLKAEPA
jgi:hypothetical protein